MAVYFIESDASFSVAAVADLDDGKTNQVLS